MILSINNLLPNLYKLIHLSKVVTIKKYIYNISCIEYKFETLHLCMLLSWINKNHLSICTLSFMDKLLHSCI